MSSSKLPSQPAPPQTTIGNPLGSKSSLEALLSLDQSNRNNNHNRDYSRVRRYSHSGSRSRERRLINENNLDSNNSSNISSTNSQFGTPPTTANTSNWLARDRLQQQQQQQNGVGTGTTGGGGNGINSTNSSGFWSGVGVSGIGEALPSNVTAGYSAFNTFSDGSHFFPPGNSAFSFEGGGGGGGGSSTDQEDSQVSLFRDTRMIRSRSKDPYLPSIPNSLDGDVLGSRSRDEDSTTNNSSWEQQQQEFLNRNKKFGIGMIGGGRKRKDASRGMSYSVSTSNQTADKGLVALAKPMGEGLDGRVVIAGKTCLRVLKVPSGEKVSTTDKISTSFKALSGLAARRSQARGSPVSIDRNLSDEKTGIYGSEKVEAGNEIVETMDIRLGSRLGPSFFFSDVKWGYGATSNKVATAFSNGAVVLWDLAKEGSNRVDQLKYEHDRAVNKVVFGGASGSWLLSGGQDGQMKLWDIRESRPASLVLKASSPVRQLSFSPSTSQPFTLLAVCSSGTLIRYDIRYTGKVAGGATDRIAGHVGACLAMDWRDNLPSESDRASGGWVVTGGMDNTIKIWDFTQVTLSTKPTTTLFSSQPIQSISWHPTRVTELASSPLPTLSVGTDEGNISPGINGMGIELGKEVLGSSWKNEIEIWDTRRPYFPKLSIKTDEPVSAIVYNDDDTIWSTSKSTPTFQQFDINSDSYAVIDSMPLAGASWNFEGELVFVDDPRTKHDIPWDPPNILNNNVASIDNPSFTPDTSIGSIINFDPDFSANTFTYLANNLVLAEMPLAEICDINADACEYVGRSDAAQLWSTIRIWLDTTPLFPPEIDIEVATESVLQTPHVVDIPLPTVETPQSRATEWVNNGSPITDLSLTNVIASTTALANTVPRRSFSNPLARTSKSNHNSPVILPTLDSPKGTNNIHHHLDDFSEESATEAEIILPPAAIKLANTTISSSYTFPRPSIHPDQHILSSSSDSDDSEELTNSNNRLPTTTTTTTPLSLFTSPKSLSNPTSITTTSRRGRSMTLGGSSINNNGSRFLDSMIDSNPSFGLQRRSSTTSTINNNKLIPSATLIQPRGEDDWEFDLPPKIIPTPNITTIATTTTSLLKSHMINEPSSDSDDSEGDGIGSTLITSIGGLEGNLIGGEDERFAKVRAAKILVRQSTKSRKNSGGSKSRPSVGSNNTNGNGNGSIVGLLSRQNSTGQNQKNIGAGLVRNGSSAKKDIIKKGPSLIELKRRVGEEQVLELKEIVKEQIKVTLIEYANRGDSQLCASICCVLSNQGFEFDLMFVARVTKAYIDLLRRSKLYAAAAGVLKYCEIDSLRSLSQTNVVHHMACGKCNKAIESPPYGTCQKCSNQITRCCICHLIVRSLYLFCPICNHGAHLQCISSTTSILSSRLSSLNSTHSHPHSYSNLNSPHSNSSGKDLEELGGDHSYPSTPGSGLVSANSSMPAIRAWFWEGEGSGKSERVSNVEVEKREIEELLNRCPSCSHKDCLLGSIS